MTLEPPLDPPPPAQMAKIIALHKTLNRAVLDTAMSMTAALFWNTDNPEHPDRLQNGSIFFLDAGAGVFGVTAAHVVRSCQQDERDAAFRGCMVATYESAPYRIDLRERIIGIHDGMDLATLRFSPAEVHAIGRTVVLGDQATWPPSLPRPNTAITYCGCPGVGREVTQGRNLKFGLVVMQGPPASAHETCISIQIKREDLEQVYGDRSMPSNFNFSSMSGGPALSQANDFTSMILQGVIFEGPNTSADPAEAIEGFELIRIRPAHFIKADGTLDVQRWESNQAW